MNLGVDMNFLNLSKVIQLQSGLPRIFPAVRGCGRLWFSSEHLRTLGTSFLYSQLAAVLAFWVWFSLYIISCS